MNTTPRIHSLRPLVLAVACLAAGASWAQVTVVVGPAPTVVDPVVAARQQEMALQLARANLSQQGITEPSIGQLALALAQLLQQAGRGSFGHGQKRVLMARVMVPSSSTTGSQRHLSNVVQGCEMPRATRSPTAGAGPAAGS